MQKVLRQNLLRRNQNLNRARRKDLQQFKKEKREYDRGVVLQTRADRENIKAERKNRREDWLLGSLAANRNVGEMRGIYGTISPNKIKAPAVPERLRNKEIPIVVDDRVVVVRGRDKGRISEVKEVQAESMTVILKGLNEADAPLPSWDPSAKQRAEKFVSQELPYNLSDVRLVVTVENGETGVVEDRIVKDIRTGDPQLEHEYGSPLPTYSRYVAGTDIPIPWPGADPVAFEAEACDTRAIDVNTVTWTPTLYWEYEPLSKCVDELRSRHARGRGIFDEDFVKEKIMEDLQTEWRQQKKLHSPAIELYEARPNKSSFPKRTSNLGELIRATQAETLGPKISDDVVRGSDVTESRLKRYAPPAVST